MKATAFTRLVGIDAPIVLAPIDGAPALVAAVSGAGGLGVLQATWLDPSGIRAALRAVRKLTDRPVGANLVLTEPRDDQLAAALAEGIQLVSFFWGDPAPYLARVHEAGALAALTVRSAAEARDAVAAGVDVIVAQGWEAGGHVWGDVATLPLVPAVRDAVGDTPVVAAGGIADGRGLAAVLALGADAAWMGTRFVASEEASFARSYKEGVAAAAETGTVHTSLFDGGWPDAPHRVLRTETVERWEAAGSPPTGRRPGEGEVVATAPDGEAIERYSSAEPALGVQGDLAALAHYAGQSAGIVNRVEPAAEIVRRTVAEADAALRRLASP